MAAPNLSDAGVKFPGCEAMTPSVPLADGCEISDCPVQCLTHECDSSCLNGCTTNPLCDQGCLSGCKTTCSAVP
jgi:hypothetical protein